MDTAISPNLAHVRMRDEAWDLTLRVAKALESQGVIWRDHDCDQNTKDNGYLNAGPCYGVSGESESLEEKVNADILDITCVNRY